MIDAVGALFGSTARPFALEAIAFHPVTAAERPDRPLYRAPARFAPGLRVSLLSQAEAEAAGGGGGTRAPIATRFARTRWMQAMARDVAELLESGATIGDRPLRPSDVAILARRKAELDAARRALEAIGIPCVSRGEGNVFESREAWELASMLDAWLHPGDPRRLRAALSTGGTASMRMRCARRRTTRRRSSRSPSASPSTAGSGRSRGSVAPLRRGARAKA